jgi:hypothetical protein
MIHIIQLVNLTQVPIYNITGEYWQKYADLHGYSYYIHTLHHSIDLHPNLYKWVAIYEYLKTIPDNDILVWVDLDTLPMNLRFKLDGLVIKDMLFYKYDITVSHIARMDKDRIHIEYINQPILQEQLHSGMVLIKKTKNTIKRLSCLVEDIIPENTGLSKLNGDEFIISPYFQSLPEYNKTIEVTTDMNMCSCPIEIYNPANGEVRPYEPGNFIIHMLGCSISDKVELLSKYKEVIV